MQVAAKEAMDTSNESEPIKRFYGIDQEVTRDYGTRCLIARRLVERGVRSLSIITITTPPSSASLDSTTTNSSISATAWSCR
jgi:Protein of unknown function (DUF1501)